MSQVGKLRYLITLQSEGGSRDAGGGIVSSWSTVDSVYADIRPVSGQERYRQGKVQETITHDIRIRYRTDITASNRVSYDSRTFNIKTVINEDERDRYLLLKCSEGEVA